MAAPSEAVTGHREAFIRAIIENPEDDAPRLIFADWLEERGEPLGEFIRVQLEIARHEAAAATRGTAFPAPPMPPGFLASTLVATLRRRERVLMALHDAEWFGGLLPMPRQRYRQGEPRITFYPGPDAEIVCHVRRGFVAGVALPCGLWCGAPCGRCEGLYYDRDCPACRGTGRVPGHGPALVRAAPLVEVRLSDKRPLPFNTSNLFAFFHRDVPPGSGFQGRWPDYLPDQPNVPDLIFTRMHGDYSSGARCKEYRTEAAAQADLGRAALAWARREAGLPPLDGTGARASG